MHYASSYIFALVVATSIAIGLALLAARRRAPGGRAFVLLMVAVAIWSTGYLLELGSDDLASKLLWARLQYIGIVAVPAAWLIFALQYTGRERWLARPHLLLLAIEPALVLLLLWTNEMHGLFWSTIQLSHDSAGNVLDTSYGAAFWAHAIYSYLLLLLGTLALLRSISNRGQLYRGQVGALLIGCCAPWISNALFLSGISPFPHLDLTPLAFTVTGIVFSWGLLRFHLLDIAPVAQSVVIHSMSDIVITLDTQSRLIDINPAARQLLGRKRAQLIGQPIGELIANWPQFSGLAAGTRPLDREITIGSVANRRTFDLRISPLRDRRMRLVGRVAVLHEITEHKRLEEALRSQKRVFEQLYAQQSQLSKELYQAKEAAEAANRAKGEFVSFVSHELKTPMTAIRGYADILLTKADGPLNLTQLDYLHVIRSSVTMMSALVSDLADSARIEAGHMQLECHAIALNTIVEQAVQSNGSQLQLKQQQLRIDIPSNLPPVWADETRLTQVLSNLVSNASKYTPPAGQITIAAELMAQAELPAGSAGFVHVQVRDTGIGISADDQQRIFQKFFRAADEQARSAPGTGLGLNITKDLVELQGGQIWFESVFRQGSVFHFSIPVAHIALPDATLLARTAGGLPAATGDFYSKEQMS